MSSGSGRGDTMTTNMTHHTDDIVTELDAALLDILLDYADDGVFGRVWVEARSLPNRPEIRPAGNEAQS